jgi:ligand-binding sensor domain-containing protein
VDTPLLNAAAKYRSVAPEQVKSLLKNNVRLGEEGTVEVVGSDGSVRYNDAGEALGVDDLVKEFLDTNPHFVQPTPSTTNTKSSISNSKEALDVSKLDMSNPEHRKAYAEMRKQRG